MSAFIDKPKVLFTRRREMYHSEAVEIFKQNFDVETWDSLKHGKIPKEKLIELVRGKFGLVVGSYNEIDRDVIAAGAPSLRVVSTVSTGVDHVDLEAMKEYRVRLGYTPDVNVEAVAELTVSLLIATSRRIVQGIAAVKNGEYRSKSDYPWLSGQGLHDSTVGIVGYGKIGHSVAVKLKSFLPKRILYTSRRVKPNGIVDQDALLKALQQNKILGAGLDVMTPEPLPIDHPLQRLENCVLLPHMGWASLKAKRDMFHLSVKNVIAVLNGTPMPAEYVL